MARNAAAGSEAGEPLVAPAGWADRTTVNDYSVSIADPETWWPGAGLHGNLHAIDVQFWFYNLKANVAERLGAWEKRHA